MKYICNKINCGKLLDKRGYCDKHAYIKDEIARKSWAIIKDKQDDKERLFYNNSLWHRRSKEHRAMYPLCEQCKKEKRITAGTLVHHNPDLRTLWEKGLNPYIDDFLETLCFACHNRKLKSIRKNIK